SNIFITGDFNLDILKQASNKKIRDICQHFNLEQLITEPTHKTENSSSAIDLIFTSDKNAVLVSGVGDPFLDQNIRYHCPIFFVLNFKKYVTHVFHRHIWLFDRGDYQSFSHEVQNTNWNELKSNDVDTYAKNITDKISNLSSKYIPNKTVKIRQSDPPWLTNEIKKMIRKRKRLYDKFKKSNRVVDFENYKQLRNKIIGEIRKSKKLQIEKLADKLRNEDVKQKDWWKTLKQFIKTDQSSTLPPLYKDDNIYTKDEDKANLMNEFFVEQTMLNDDNTSLPTDVPQPQNFLNLISTTPTEVRSILKSLQLGKAAGPDSINNRILKELATPLSVPLSELFNFSLSKGKVPNIWKEANVTPIFKKDDPSNISNYRPISLLSTICKVLEKIVHKHLFNFIRDHNLLTSLQSGFIPGDSTVNQLVHIYNTFCKALDEGKEVRAVFCDISKAFDRVWHKGLLYKLQSIGISGSLLQWFTDYLHNRKQRVVLPGTASSWSIIKAGVPQGSILGPLLFLIYINDIVVDIQSSIRLFADDTSLYIVVENPMHAAAQINSDLAKIHSWATKWLVSFNPAKSESMIFSRKINKPNHPHIAMNQQHIKEVHSHKHLGLIFSTDCTWHDHIDNIKTKAWFRVNIMRKLKFTLDRKSLQTIYTSFIRPLLEYADVVWDNCTRNEAYELEKIQHEAARIVTGATKLVSIHSLLCDLGWESLEARRQNHKLVLYYKMQNSLTPEYLSSLVPVTVGSTTSYELRNNANLQIVRANSQLYYTSFLPSVTRNWNDLSDDQKSAPSVASFKHKLQANERKSPSYFCAGKRLGQVHHARLRLNCSSLHQHLFRKNIVNSSLCACGAVEDTHHYLLACEQYTDIRQELINIVSAICQPSLNILLYGSTDLSANDNTQIVLAVHDFIL
ncbi:MAG: reverse transcriptase domain-containing protein, partial [Candidatus Thiodiazotropha endolucinida]|nr:hypothetical protein [Candidatus Thiodiazotropha taylori]MCW4301023.1 reverse transcriptase domain-containing protein [Candidatus Thiodiazotropha endolucinida]